MSQFKVFPDQPLVPLSMGSRSHKFIQLPNGLVALIISDPTEDIASFSLSVATGHHADPDDVSGLAHLCEHMVCVSSKEYTEIDLYKNLVLKAGGQFNAVTIAEKTTYYFDIPISENLSSATKEPMFNYILKVFASYFKSPLFNQGYIRREIIAVDNEHVKNCSAVNRLSYHGLRLLSNPDHQFHRFCTGNFYTLNDLPKTKKVNIRNELINFYNKEYTPNKMSLVIRGPQSLNFLTKLLVSNFSDLSSHVKTSKLAALKGSGEENYNILRPNLSELNIVEDSWKSRYRCLPFDTTNLGKIIFINNDSSTSILRLVFLISPETELKFSKKIISLFIGWWCSIFGDESKSSLNSILFKQEYIREACSMTPEISSQCSTIELQLTLTPHGSRNLDTVLYMVFDYVNSVFTKDSLKHTSKLLSQLNDIDLYNYLHSDVTDNASGETKDLSRLLLDDQKILSRWIVKGAVNFEVSDETRFCGSYGESPAAKQWWSDLASDFITFIQETMTLKRMVVSLIGQESNLAGTKCMDMSLPYERDQYFGFSYKISKLSIPDDKKQTEICFKFPRPNQFCTPEISRQSHILERLNSISTSSALGYSIQNTSAASVPKLIFVDDGFQLWYKKESGDEYNERTFLTLELINTGIKASVEDTLSLEIICDLVKESLREVLYPSLMLNYSYDIFPSLKGENGVLIHVSGPSSNVFGVLQFILTEFELFTMNFRESVKMANYRNARVRLKLKFDDLKNFPSIMVASLGLIAVLEENTWELSSRFEALEDIDFESTAKLAEHLFDDCYLSCFMHGDIKTDNYKDDLLPLLYKVVKRFSGDKYRQPSTVLIPKGSNFAIHRESPDETNSLVYFVQTGSREDMYTRTLTKFLAFVLSTNFLSKIRTQYQLGYAVLAGLRTLRKTVGIHISIMSGEHSPEDLDFKIDEIILEWYEEFLVEIKKNIFKEDYISKFLESLTSSNQKLNQSGGPSSLTSDSIGGNLSKTKIMKQHQGYWDQITNRSYKFSHDISGDDSVDISIIEKLKPEDFLDFVQKRFLPNSPIKSKVSIMLTSKYSKEEIENRLKPIRIYSFLSAVGLPIKMEKLQEILNKTDNSQLLLGKELFKYYKAEGTSLMLISAGMAKLSVGYYMSSKSGSSLTGAHSNNPPRVEIENLQKWQKMAGFYVDQSSMRQVLMSYKN